MNEEVVATQAQQPAKNQKKSKAKPPAVVNDRTLRAGDVVMPAPMTPMDMLAQAIEKGVDLAQMEKLLDLQQRWEANEAKKAFVKAFSAFKADPPELFKNKTVAYQNKDTSMTTYDHATLDHICAVLAPALSQHGLAFNWTTAQEPGGVIVVTCNLTHEMGHTESVPLKSVPDNSGGKNGIQAVGSAITYLQRYTLLAATGMSVKGMDDDGLKTGDRDKKPEPGAPQDTTVWYPEEKFKANISSWKAKVATGGSDPESIIRKVETAGKLTEAQKKEIRDAKFPEGGKK